MFRISPLGHVAVLTLAFCLTPIALTVPAGLALYLVPLGLSWWIARLRTTVDADAVAVRGILHARRVTWNDLTALRLRSGRTRSRVSAVLAGGSELPLPAVRVRDLPLLAEVSGGRLPDPSPTTQE